MSILLESVVMQVCQSTSNERTPSSMLLRVFHFVLILEISVLKFCPNGILPSCFKSSLKVVMMGLEQCASKLGQTHKILDLRDQTKTEHR